MKRNIFITGATGFVGQRLVHELLKKEPATSFWLLIRKSRQGNARERMQVFLQNASRETGIPERDLQERFHLVEGDVDKPNLGLSDGKFDELARNIQIIYHVAASVNLEKPLETARQSIVGASKTMLRLAEKSMDLGSFSRFNYFSTAYVAGKRTGLIYEHELDEGQGFNNSYEQAKMESEKEVRQAMDHLPITVFRPSMIMGDSRTGWTNAFNVLYIPIKLAYFGKLPIFPGSKHLRGDTVPIDFVIDATLYLSSLDKEVIGKTFHLTVGVGRGVTSREFIDKSQEYYRWVDDHGLKNPKVIPTLLHPRIFSLLNWLGIHLTTGARRRFLERMHTYTRYALHYKEFNNDQAKRLLEPQGIVPPRLVDYLEVICKYCFQTHFGTADGPRDVF